MMTDSLAKIIAAADAILSAVVGFQEYDHCGAFEHAAARQAEALKVLAEFACVAADYDNPNEPRNVCWPASEHMSRAREALAKAVQILETEK